MQDTTSIYSSLDSDQLQGYTRVICESEDEGQWEHPEFERKVFEDDEDE